MSTSNDSLKVRLYRSAIRPIEPRLYALICSFLNRSYDDGTIRWNGNEVIFDPAPEDERKAGRYEAELRNLGRLALSMPAIWSGMGIFGFEPLSTAWSVSAVVFLVFGFLWMASSHGLETPKIVGGVR